jgi:hypothetical protein
VAEFRTAPTWLDTQDLVTGGVEAQQDAELFNVLLRASHWADNFCGQRLGAHTAFEQFRARVDRQGRIKLHPSNVPVRQVTALAYGPDPQNLTALTDFSQVWVEDARGIVVSAIPFRSSFFGTLQFGMVPVGGSEIYVQIQYVAGYACTVLSATEAAGATSITVADATGVQGASAPSVGLSVTLPGSTLRIWDAPYEEAVTVASVNGSTLTLASPLLSTHTVGSGAAGQVSVSELPPEIHQAIIAMAVALMLREDVTGEDPFAGTPGGPPTRRSSSGGQAGGLLDNAYELLEPYRRVR